MGQCSDLVLPEDNVTAIACSLCGEWMHKACILKTTDISETMKVKKARNDVFDVDHRTRDHLRIFSTSLQFDCTRIVCSRCKGNGNIRKLINKLRYVVTKTDVKLDQYKERPKEMEAKMDDDKETIVGVGDAKPNCITRG